VVQTYGFEKMIFHSAFAAARSGRLNLARRFKALSSSRKSLGADKALKSWANFVSI